MYPERILQFLGIGMFFSLKMYLFYAVVVCLVAFLPPLYCMPAMCQPISILRDAYAMGCTVNYTYGVKKFTEGVH